MVWGCTGWEGVGRLAEVEGKMDADQQVSILEDNLLPSLEESGFSAKDVIFQQDNDFKHTSKKASKKFEDNDINCKDSKYNFQLLIYLILYCHLQQLNNNANLK